MNLRQEIGALRRAISRFGLSQCARCGEYDTDGHMLTEAGGKMCSGCLVVQWSESGATAEPRLIFGWWRFVGHALGVAPESLPDDTRELARQWLADNEDLTKARVSRSVWDQTRETVRAVDVVQINERFAWIVGERDVLRRYANTLDSIKGERFKRAARMVRIATG